MNNFSTHAEYFSSLSSIPNSSVQIIVSTHEKLFDSCHERCGADATIVTIQCMTSAPMGPFVVSKEFLPDFANLRITTKVNGEIVQDSNTSYLIHGVEYLLRSVTSPMRLWPGDVIATGTPSSVGAGRKPPVFLKSGDTVAIEIEGTDTLVTPID